MVSKNSSDKNVKRIPETRVVGPSRFVKQKEGAADFVVGPSNPYRSLSTQALAESSESFELADEDVDRPELSDIENVQKIKYFDPVSKIEKTKLIIKVRNSSKNKSNVIGVDARIPPKEA